MTRKKYRDGEDIKANADVHKKLTTQQIRQEKTRLLVAVRQWQKLDDLSSTQRRKWYCYVFCTLILT